jgi:hypothetical protein
MTASTVHESHARPLIARLLLLDAVVCAVFGIGLVVAAGPLADLFDLPMPLLRLVGVGLLPWAAFLLLAGIRPVVSRAYAWTVIGANWGWAAASILLLFSGRVEPSAVGIVFVVVQAAFVALLADAQFLALRRHPGRQPTITNR